MKISAKSNISNRILAGKIKNMPVEEIERNLFSDLHELNAMSVKDFLSMMYFFKYLVDKKKNKAFVTYPDSIVARHAEILRDVHGCKIRMVRSILSSK